MSLTQKVNFVVIIPEYSPVDKFRNKKGEKKVPRNGGLSIPFSFLLPPTNFLQNIWEFIFPPLVNKMKSENDSELDNS